MITDDNGLNFWDRLGCIWLEINQPEFDLLKEMAKSKLKTEEKKLNLKKQYAAETVNELDELERLIYRVEYLKKIINTKKIPISNNKSNYKD